MTEDPNLQPAGFQTIQVDDQSVEQPVSPAVVVEPPAVVVEPPAAAPAPAETDEVAALKAELAQLKAEKEARQVDTGVSTSSSKQRIRIRIERSSDPSEVQVPFVAINGRGYSIQRGKEVDVPPEVVEVLRNAQVGRPVINDKDEVVGYEDALRHPFSVIGEAVNIQGERLLPDLGYEVETRNN